MPRIGCVCYATARGLGYLAKSFFDHGVVTDVAVIEHRGVPTQTEWYPGALRTPIGKMDRGALMDFAAGMDAMLFFETPFDWGLLDFCRGRGIRTALVTMHECSLRHPPAVPDVYVCPSLLDMKYFPADKSVFLTLPVEKKWRQRKCASHYIHNGGYLGLRGREGTTLLIEAMTMVRKPVRLTLRVQENVDAAHQRLAARDSRIEYVAATVPYDDLYATGDVCVQPQKFNGCSLPLQEAYASGLAVMTTDRFPMNAWLPREPLIPVKGYDKASIGGAYLEFDEARIDPCAIAAVMDAWFGRDVSILSSRGKTWAEENSWEKLKPKWLKTVLGE